jgi:hypothetical protein
MSYRQVRKGSKSKKWALEIWTRPRATLTSKGHVVIARATREQIGLRPGGKLDFVLQDDLGRANHRAGVHTTLPPDEAPGDSPHCQAPEG